MTKNLLSVDREHDESALKIQSGLLMTEIIQE